MDWKIWALIVFYILGCFLALLKYRKLLLIKKTDPMDWIGITIMSWLSVIDDTYIYSILISLPDKEKLDANKNS